MYIDFKVRIFIFLVIFLIQVKFDYILFKCKNILGKILILLHHLLNIYLLLGSILFENHLIHLFIILIGLIGHKLIGKCPLTIYTNKLCFDKKEKHRPFITILNHILNILNIHNEENIKKTYYSLMILIIIYDLYFINKKYKIIKL